MLKQLLAYSSDKKFNIPSETIPTSGVEPASNMSTNISMFLVFVNKALLVTFTLK